MTELVWRRSSRSSSSGNNCVEFANTGGAVTVRDSKNPQRGHLTVSRAAFARFAAQLKR